MEKFEKYASRIPKTTLNWKKPTSRPRNLAGAISAMYIGPRTEDPPIPNPPIRRNRTSEYQFHATAQPTAEITYNTAITRRLSRRPYRSPGNPASIAPKIVPHSALATVTPSRPGESWYVWVSAAVVPEITAVSNPNQRPPHVAITVLLTNVALRLISPPGLRLGAATAELPPGTTSGSHPDGWQRAPPPDSRNPRSPKQAIPPRNRAQRPPQTRRTPRLYLPLSPGNLLR